MERKNTVGDRWTDAMTGTGMVVIGTGWKRARWEEDAERVRARVSGAVAHKEPDISGPPDADSFQTAFCISVPACDEAAGTAALGGS